MNLVGEAPVWGVAAYAVLLVLAAVQDGVMQKISNLIVIGLVLAGVVMAAISGIDLSLWTNGAVLLAILVLGSFAFSAGMLGGGDVKLLAATAFWFDPKDLLVLLPAVAVAGGLLVLVWLPLRMARGKAAMRGALREKSLPYGIAIALGGVVAGSIARGYLPWGAA